MIYNFDKILIIHPGGIGDLVVLTPSLKILKENFPNAKIDIFVSYTTNAAGILQGPDIINRIFSFNFQKNIFFNKIKFIHKLRKEKYDLVIVASGVNPFKGSLFAFLIGAKTRVGEYRKSKLRFYTHQVKLNEDKHKIETNLNLLKALDIKIGNSVLPLIFTIDNNDKKFANEFIKKNNLKNKILIGFSFASGYGKQFKDWPKENFIELGKKILDNFPNISILLFGSLNEKDLCSEISNGLKRNVISIIDYPLKMVVTLIDKCKIFVASDTGLGHIAATTNTNLIAIFGPTIPKRTGPVGTKVYIIEGKCKYRYHDIFTPKYDTNKKHQCLKKITPDRVFNEIKKILYEKTN